MSAETTQAELGFSPHYLPSGVGPTLEALCARASFQAAELQAHLEQEATLALVQYLAEEGFLTTVAG
jgi:hypothetical protein